jgi:hypothetical protein
LGITSKNQQVGAGIWLAISFLTGIQQMASAQYLYFPVSYEYRIQLDRQNLLNPDKKVHPAIHPIARGEFGGGDANTPFLFFDADRTSSQNVSQSWWHRKLFEEHLLTISGDGYEVNLDPWLNTELGVDPGINDRSHFTFMSSRGIWIEGRIGKKVSFYSGFSENLGAFPDALTQYFDSTGFVLGSGNYQNQRGESNIDFPMAAGAVSFQPSKHFNISFGQGKHFFGEGYRSMILSDYALPYPFLKIESKLGSLSYTNLWAVHADPRASAWTPGRLYRQKYTSIHYLSWNATDKWNISLFESMVWGGDSVNPNAGFYIHFLNPVVFWRPVEKLVGIRGGNAMIGLASSYVLGNGMKVYGQFVIDDFQLEALKQIGEGHWLNFYSWQLGWKKYQKLGARGHLSMRFEYNGARPFMYAHRTPSTNYTHLMYPLAHPWGSNFQEFIVQVQYQNKRWVYDFQLNYGIRGQDIDSSNYGNDLFRSIFDRDGDLGYGMGGRRNEFVVYGHTKVGFILNMSTGMRLEAGMRIRNSYVPEEESLEKRSYWFFTGFRMPLFNRYFDI